MNKFITVAASLSLFSAPAFAREWPKTAGWEISEGETFCMMWSDFQGPGDTEFVLAIDVQDRPLVSIQNTDWSIKPDERYVVAMVTKDQGVHGRATGFKSDTYPYKKGLRGFVSVAGFLDSLAKSPYLHFYLAHEETDDFDFDKATVLDKLDMEGSAAALATVQRCVATLKREAAAEKARKDAYERKWKHIPRDPFAESSPKP